MNFLQIKYCLEVCRTLNFTSAAENMHISQPAFSRQIRLLEEEIGAPLLIRDNRKVILTHAGEVFFREFSPLMKKMEEAYEKVKREAVPCKEIRIGIFQPLKYNVLMPILDNMQKYYKDYKLVLVKSTASELQVGYLNEELDVILADNTVDLRLPHASSVVTSYRQAAVVMSKELAEELEEPFEFKELEGKNLLCIDEKVVPGFKMAYQEIAKRLNIQPGEIVICRDIIGSLFGEEAKSGFTFFPMEITDAPERIQFYEIPIEQYRFEIVAWWNRNNPQHLDKFFYKMYKMND